MKAKHVRQKKVEYWWVFFCALLLQFLILPLSSEYISVRIILLMLSYLLLLFGVAQNLHLWTIRIIGLGLLLNLIAMAANSGLMPVTTDALARAELLEMSDGSQSGMHLVGAKLVLLKAEQVRLAFLTDVLAISTPIRNVFSLGDIIVAAGLFIFPFDFLRYRRWQQRLCPK